MKPVVLITRPRPDADTLAEAVSDRGFSPLIEPLLEIRPLSVRRPDPADYQALIFTSANAVRVFAEMTPDRAHPVYCTGGHTAETARSFGWHNVTSAAGDGTDLSRLLAESTFEARVPLLHPAGEDIATPVAATGVAIERLTIYKADKAVNLSADCLTCLDQNGLSAALFFSARTARVFADLLEQYGRTESVSTTKALCLADSVVKSLEHLPWLNVQVADRPTRDSLLDLLGRCEDR